jgi:hypothetical protein
MTEMTDDSQTGGSPIISYSVAWDSGTSGNSWSDRVGYTDNNMVLIYDFT